MRHSVHNKLITWFFKECPKIYKRHLKFFNNSNNKRGQTWHSSVMTSLISKKWRCGIHEYRCDFSQWEEIIGCNSLSNGWMDLPLKIIYSTDSTNPFLFFFLSVILGKHYLKFCLLDKSYFPVDKWETAKENSLSSCSRNTLKE